MKKTGTFTAKKSNFFGALALPEDPDGETTLMGTITRSGSNSTTRFLLWYVS